MAISNSAQFVLLLWKNWLLQKRRKVVTAVQILIPALFALVLMLIRLIVDSKYVSSPTIWDSFEASTSLPEDLTPPTLPHLGNRKWMLVYSPNTSLEATSIAYGVAKMLNLTSVPYGMSMHSFEFLNGFLFSRSYQDIII